MQQTLFSVMLCPNTHLSSIHAFTGSAKTWYLLLISCTLGDFTNLRLVSSLFAAINTTFSSPDNSSSVKKMSIYLNILNLQTVKLMRIHHTQNIKELTGKPRILYSSTSTNPRLRYKEPMN
jgi:hypothetical protein